MQTKDIVTVIFAVAARIEEEKLFLTELDNVIGDGDHGINLARGFAAVKAKLETAAINQPSDVFKTVGMTLVTTVGGAAGPLYGTAFLNMAKTLTGKADVGIGDFLSALHAAVDGVMMRGKSQAGEKTMLDAMIPAVNAMDRALSEQKSVAQILTEGTRAAYEGVEYTKTIAATKGRAAYLGERSIGHQDPGATSFSVRLEELKKAVI